MHNLKAHQGAGHNSVTAPPSLHVTEWNLENVKGELFSKVDLTYKELKIPFRKELSVFKFSPLEAEGEDKKAYFIRSWGKDWEAFSSYLLVDIGKRLLLVQGLGGATDPKEGGGNAILTEESMLGLKIEGHGQIEYVSGRFFSEKSGRNVIIEQ